MTTADNQASKPRIVDLGAMTPRQLAREFGLSIAEAEEERAIARGNWAGCIFEVGADGLARPKAHGEFWNPGPGEARTDPWPNGTYGRQPRNRIRRWRKAWAAERMAKLLDDRRADSGTTDNDEG